MRYRMQGNLSRAFYLGRISRMRSRSRATIGIQDRDSDEYYFGGLGSRSGATRSSRVSMGGSGDAGSRIYPYGENYDAPYTSDWYAARSGGVYTPPKNYGFNDARPLSDGGIPTQQRVAEYRAQGIKTSDAKILARRDKFAEKHGRPMSYDEIRREAWDSEKRNLERASNEQMLDKRVFDMQARSDSLGLREQRQELQSLRDQRSLDLREAQLMQQESLARERLSQSQQRIDIGTDQFDTKRSDSRNDENAQRIRNAFSMLQKQYDNEMDPVKKAEIKKRQDAYVTLYGDLIGTVSNDNNIETDNASTGSESTAEERRKRFMERMGK